MLLPKLMLLPRLICLLIILAPLLRAQSETDSPKLLAQVLQRLDALEKQNQELAGEVHSLRQELAQSKVSAPDETQQASATAAPPPVIDDRVTVNSQRIDEQAQTKVEASQKFPVQLTGMLLFNAFGNSANSGNPNSIYNPLLTGPDRSGATIRQSLLGFNYQGPHLPGDGRVNASLLLDFWAGSPQPGSSWVRLRQADVSLDWKHRSFSVGQEKSLISPYQPSSLAEVAIPPLAGAGNLWLWLPQARYEERVFLGTHDGLTGQIALLQTDETYSTLPLEYTNLIDRARPAVEGRIAYWHRFDDQRRLEIGSGFHTSKSHVEGQSASSHIVSLDWSYLTGPRLQITGTFFRGQNVAGLGALGNGVAFPVSGLLKPVQSSGGWNQFSFPLTSRLTFGIFGGVESDNPADLVPSSIVRNFSYASNLTYHLGPNVVIAVEALQSRTRSVSGDNAVHNHYDLAVGYLF